MGLTAALDVAIGIVFVYLVLSLVCTSINETIASLFRLRARVLHEEISRLIDDEKIHEAFWGSGLIRSLSRPQSDIRRRLRIDTESARGPSYIPSATFATALFQAIASKPKTPEAEGNGADSNLFSKIDEGSLLRDVVRELSQEIGQDVAALKTALARWYDQAMERTSGAYKRNLQAVSFFVALGLAAAFNADSIAIARALWFDETLRQQIADSAFEVVEQGGYADEMLEFEEIQHQLRPLPLGWDLESPPLSTDWYRTITGWGAKLIGLLLTAFAITLGAPFWFDLLSRFVKLRGAGAVGEPPSRAEAANPGSGASR